MYTGEHNDLGILRLANVVSKPPSKKNRPFPVSNSGLIKAIVIDDDKRHFYEELNDNNFLNPWSRF